MAGILQLRRGTTAELSAITGSQGEVFVNTDTNQLVVMDGVTPGGTIVGNTAVGNITGLVAFDSVAQLKAQSLNEGDVVKTKGYYTAGDAGSAEYIIKSGVTADGWGSHTIANGLTAVLTPVTEYYRASQWGGAQGDVTKDTPAVQAMINAGKWYEQHRTSTPMPGAV